MAKNSVNGRKIADLDTYTDTGVNAIIETPMGGRAKFSYDEATGLFKLRSILPAGAVFPYNFGFLPSTLADDGDPIDVLVLMEAVAGSGCLIPSRLIGVIEAEQIETDGSKQRNDRLLAVSEHCPSYGRLRSIEQLSSDLLDQIEYFFISYNRIRNKKFKPIGRFGPDRADQLVKQAQKNYEQKKKAALQL